MKDRSQIAMLIGLVVLILVVLNLSPAFNINFHFGFLRGAFPWLLLVFGIWFFFGKGCGGGCCKRKAESREA